jgi:hypothetical protein
LSESHIVQNRPAESLGDFLLRLAVSSILLAAGLKIFTSLVGELIAWGAGNLIAAASSKYYLESLNAIGNGFTVRSWMSPIAYGFELHSLMLAFGLPVAFALALPGASSRGYWMRLLSTVLASYFVCVLVVAFVADRTLITNFANYGLQLQPYWRENFSETVVSQLWAFTTVGFPLIMTLLLAPATGQLSPELEKYFGGSKNSNPNWVLATLTAILVLCIAIDPIVRSEHDTVRKSSAMRYFEDIESLNPDHFGESLVVLAKSMARQEDLNSAIIIYRVALRHLKGRALRKARSELDELVVTQRTIRSRDAARSKTGKKGNRGNRRKKK